MGVGDYLTIRDDFKMPDQPVTVDDALVYDNTLYRVVFGVAVTTSHNAPLFKVVNKQFGCIEMETPFLMMALNQADACNEGVIAHGEATRQAEGVVLS